MKLDLSTSNLPSFEFATYLPNPYQDATLSQRVTARLFFLKKHSKIIKRVLIGNLSKVSKLLIKSASSKPIAKYE